MNVYNNDLVDSQRWRFFRPRSGDLIVATYPKSGTTWMQNILLHLVATVALNENPLWKISPRLERKRENIEDVISLLEKQSHRRVIKTHLPYDQLPFFPESKYVIVVRDLRDAGISLWNFYNNLIPDILLSEGISLPSDFETFWRDWTCKDGYPFQSPTHFLKTWWTTRKYSNVHFVHYDDLLTDTKNEITKLCHFIEHEPNFSLDEVIAATSFSVMKENSSNLFRGEILKNGSSSFFRKGTSGQWKELLSEEQQVMYRTMLESNLSQDCIQWLENK